MPNKIVAVVCLAAVSAAAVGCAGPSLQARYDQLAREQEDLLRQKAQAEADLLACQARCESLERQRAVPEAPRAGVTPAPYEVPVEGPAGLDIRRRGSDTVIDIPSDVFFASGSSTLNREGERAMGQVVEYIRRAHPGGMIRVEGHSDTDPIRRTKSKYHCNWELSFERSHAVVHHLVEKGGLDARRVVAEAHGEFHPAHPSNKAKNRRVEIVIAP